MLLTVEKVLSSTHHFQDTWTLELSYFLCFLCIKSFRFKVSKILYYYAQFVVQFFMKSVWRYTSIKHWVFQIYYVLQRSLDRIQNWCRSRNFQHINTSIRIGYYQVPVKNVQNNRRCTYLLTDSNTLYLEMLSYLKIV